MASMSATAANSITFPSQAALEKALKPLGLEEVTRRISSAPAEFALDLRFDETLSERKLVPLRNPGTGDLLKTEVYQTKTLTVFYPETPRVPHHLTIALNRGGIKGVGSVSEEENRELFATIRKIAEIYKTIHIQGFVIAQFDTPQQGHLDRYVVEVIPHLPAFNEINNIVDKADCNRHVLFRTANISPVKYPIEPGETLGQAAFWQAAFQKKQAPLQMNDTRIVFPNTRKESHRREAERMLYHQLLEILQDKGGQVAEEAPFTAIMPVEVPEAVNSVTITKCAFCDEAVIERQLVYEYQDVFVFYNMRKGAKEGSFFLLLPKRHTEKVYGLNPNEIHNISVVRKALVEILKETHPECEVIIYTQDDPATGQTVFHTHEQVVAIDPKTIALTWTMLSLYPSGNVSNEEMLKVRKEFGLKLEQKLKEIAELENTA